MKRTPRPAHPFGLGVPHRRRRALYATLALAFGTGILWLIFHYFLMRRGDFGLEPHPLEVWWLRLHGASAFAMLWFTGVLWGTHAYPAFAQTRWRASGVAMLALIALLAITGYLLYYTADDDWQSAARLVHWVLGLSFAVPVLIHFVGARRARRQRAPR
ncbi:MAG TPA: hypothetical protein VFB32_17940 [Rudaea sp.]|nr:hypothetical protein [Rudaea sp.]